MNSKLTTQAYALAKERYAAIGIDTEEVLEQLHNRSEKEDNNDEN